MSGEQPQYTREEAGEINQTLLAINFRITQNDRYVGGAFINMNERSLMITEFLDNEHFSGLESLIIQLNNSSSDSKFKVLVNLPTDLLKDKIQDILGFVRDIALAAKLPSSELSSAKQLAIQELAGLEDDPRGQVLRELRRNHFPHPYCNSRYGTPEGIKAVTHANLKSFWECHCHAKGSILSVAGLVDPLAVFAFAEKHLSDWAPGKETPIKIGKRGPQTVHVEKETQQTQIAIAWDSVHPSHPDYYQAQGLVNVLSGGMSSRLFTEVREKQGLCYAVWATYVPLHDRGAIFSYAGTSNDRAHLTLESVKREIARITDGITKEEVDQVRVGLKTALLMQEDSSMSRCSSLASDWFNLGRVRPLEEIEAAVDGLTPKSILEYARKFAPKELTQVTMGPELGKATKAAPTKKTAEAKTAEPKPAPAKKEIAPKKDAKGKAAQKPAPADKDSTVKVAGKAKAKTLVTAKVAVIPTKAKPVAKSATKASAKAKPEAKPVKSTPKRK